MYVCVCVVFVWCLCVFVYVCIHVCTYTYVHAYTYTHLECQRLKAQVVQKIRSNQQLEQDLSIMDIKIGLLVKNRISLEDVVSHTHQVRS